MSMEVAKILLDPTTSAKTFRKVLNMNDMQVVKKFSPVVSEYKFQLTPNVRRILTLTEDEFVSKEQRLKNGIWKDSIEMRSFGTAEELENDLILCVENLNDMIARFPKKFKHVRPF